MSHTRALPVTARESRRRRRCTPSARGVSDATLFTPGVDRVHFHSTCHGFMPVRVERSVPQSPKLIRKHWGPSRRDAPHGAHSTPTPATRNGVTARPIQPRRRASLPTVAKGQAGRWHGPCPSAVKWRAVVRCSVGRCARRYRVPVGTRNTPHPSRGSRTEHEPEYAHAAESCLRRCRDRPDPERGETPA